MNGAARKRKSHIPSGCLWKGPLGCLGFATGLMLVLSILMPYACGKVSKAELEAQFDRAHKGQLRLDRARLGALVGDQGFWGISLLEPGGRQILRGDLVLPSVGQLVAPGDEQSVIELSLERVDLREVTRADGVQSSNLHQALAPPEVPPDETALTAADGKEGSSPGGRNQFPIETGNGGDDGSIRFEFGGDSFGLDTSPTLKLRGNVALLTWRGLEDELLLTMSNPELWGSIQQSDTDNATEGSTPGTSATLEMRGEVMGQAPSESTGDLHVLVRYQSNAEHEFRSRPTELVVELDGGDAALAEALEDALSVLSQGLMQRQGTDATWTLVQPE